MALHTYIDNGTFISKTSWKNLVNEKIRELCVAERARKVQECPWVNRILNIRGTDRNFIIWNLTKQFPNYLSLAYKAVRMLGRMFSHQWYHNCYVCGDLILSETTHLLLYSHSLNQFREVLWYNLLSHFGLHYFTIFMSYSPERQIDLLFTGSREILNDEKDVIDCIKIFLMSLTKIPAKFSCII